MLEGPNRKMRSVVLNVTQQRYDRDKNPADSREKATRIMKETQTVCYRCGRSQSVMCVCAACLQWLR